MAQNFSQSGQNNQNFFYMVAGMGVMLLVCVCLAGVAVGGYFFYDRLTGNYEDKIVGVWLLQGGDYDYRIEFSSDGDFHDSDGDDARYHIEDDLLILSDEEGTMKIKIEELSSEKMVLTYYDYDETVTYTKVR